MSVYNIYKTSIDCTFLLLCLWSLFQLALYPGHLSPAFVACSTKVREGLVSSSLAVVYLMSGGCVEEVELIPSVQLQVSFLNQRKVTKTA